MAAAALAARRHSGGTSRLAPPDRVSAADRPVAKRPVPQRPGGAGVAAGRPGARGPRSGRHPARAVHVLPSVADARFGDRAHAPRGRRADHGRDRERVPRGRGDHGSANQQGEAADQGVRRAVPDADARRAEPRRLRAVLRVLYLIFNEGYAGSTGAELQRVELADEAIRLTRMVHRLLPEDGEVAGLLALMLLIDARRPAPNRRRRRAGPAGGSRTERSWDQALDRRGRCSARRRDGQAAGRRVPAPSGDRGPARPGSNRRRHRLASDPRACTGCWRRSPATRSSR